MSFHIFEDISNGITDVFLAHTKLTYIDPAIWQDENFDLEEYNNELELVDREKIFSILHNPISLGKNLDISAMLYVVTKNKLEITDYCELVQKYITESCDFIDQDYAVYLKINSQI
jgi:hypothetical protein